MKKKLLPIIAAILYTTALPTFSADVAAMEELTPPAASGALDISSMTLPKDAMPPAPEKNTPTNVPPSSIAQPTQSATIPVPTSPPAAMSAPPAQTPPPAQPSPEAKPAVPTPPSTPAKPAASSQTAPPAESGTPMPQSESMASPTSQLPT